MVGLSKSASKGRTFLRTLRSALFMCIFWLTASSWLVWRRFVSSNNLSDHHPQGNDGPPQSIADFAPSPDKGPWDCAYHDNAEGTGSPLATLTMEHIASDWQKVPGYGYDGPPLLNDTKHNFYLQCKTTKMLVKGSYKLMPYLYADYLRIVVDDKQVYFNTGERMRGIPNKFANLEALSFDTTRRHTFEVTVGVQKINRSWFVFSIARVHSREAHNNDLAKEDFSDEDKIACGTTPECHGRNTQCLHRMTKGLSITEMPWGLCKDFVPANKCLVYSFGVRDIYTAELLYGRAGCEVHAFDCTVNYAEALGENVKFHPWCLGSDSSELKLDGALSHAKEQAQQREFLDLPSIIKRLGHESSELTILKMDCEGCEWNGLNILSRSMPEFFSRIRMLLLEMHYVTNHAPGTKERAEELKTIARVADSLSDFRTFGYSVNSDLSIGRFQNPMFYNELYDAGLFAGACCYEFAMVRKDLIL